MLLGGVIQLRSSARPACRGRCTYVLEAAAHAGFDVAAPEGRHLAKLPRDLDGVVQQEPQLPLVTGVPGARYLPEQICGGQGGGA